MKTESYRFRLMVILCVAGLLFLTLPLTATALLLAVLVPLWCFFAAVVVLEIRSIDELCDSLQSPLLPIFSARPPPVR
ncbi:MAG: hypothetical protein ACYDCU_03705 [Candidatus Acidiferrales bacterium]